MGITKLEKQDSAISHQALLVQSRQQQAQINVLQKKLREIVEGFAIIERNMAVAVNGNPADAPFPLQGDEALIHHRAQASAYQHALEMLSSQTLTTFVEAGFDDQFAIENEPTLIGKLSGQPSVQP